MDTNLDHYSRYMIFEYRNVFHEKNDSLLASWKWQKKAESSLLAALDCLILG